MASRDEKKLKTGFTTGAAAAAAVKGALYLLIRGHAPTAVTIRFIGGGQRTIAIHTCKTDGSNAVCTVIKDAGDDPDVTHKAEIGASVSIISDTLSTLTITGGKGVGKVTKPGLETPVGEPAINSGPRQMIQTAVSEMLAESNQPSASVRVEVFVPNGEQLAKKTLNARLGIIGGISILGTTGIVRPMSHESYIATIRSSLSVASACQVKRLFFTTGRRSERYARGLWPDDPEEAFIQTGDFFKMSLEAAAEMGFEQIILTVFFGKALKMAYGIPHTHAAKQAMCMRKLSDWALEISNDTALAAAILSANTARQAFYRIKDTYPDIIHRVGREMTRAARQFTHEQLAVRSVILDFEGHICVDSNRDFEA